MKGKLWEIFIFPGAMIIGAYICLKQVKEKGWENISTSFADLFEYVGRYWRQMISTSVVVWAVFIYLIIKIFI